MNSSPLMGGRTNLYAVIMLLQIRLFSLQSPLVVVVVVGGLNVSMVLMYLLANNSALIREGSFGVCPLREEQL